MSTVQNWQQNDLNRYQQRIEQLATKQASGNMPYQGGPTLAYQGNASDARREMQALPAGSTEKARAMADEMRQYQQTQAEREAYARQYEQAFGGSPTASLRQMQAYPGQSFQQTQAYPGRPFQRTPYQQVLDDYDINSYPPMQSAPRQSYAPPQQSRFGGAPMPNRSPGQAQYTPLPDRNPGQAQYTPLPDRNPGQAQYAPLPDRNPGQAQMTPYSNSMQGGMNRKMNYRGR